MSPDLLAEQLLRGLHALTKRSPFLPGHHYEVSERYAWVLPGALKVANLFIRDRLALSFDPVVLDLFLGLFAVQSYGRIVPSTREGLLKDAESWPEFRFRLFWHAVADARRRVTERTQYPQAWWHVRAAIRDFWLPSAIDQDRLSECVATKLLYDRFTAGQYQNRQLIWLHVLLCVNGIRGYQVLTEWIASLSSEAEQREKMIELCARLTNSGDSHFVRAARDYEKIEVLRQFLPFIYRFVTIEDDMRHQGVYTPGERDRAQEARSRLVSVIFDTPGRPSYMDGTGCEQYNNIWSFGRNPQARSYRVDKEISQGCRSRGCGH